MTAAARDAAVERLKSGNGLNTNQKLKDNIAELGADNLSYMFIDGGVFKKFLKGYYSTFNYGDFAQYFDFTGDSYMALVADTGGIHGYSKMNFDGKKED